MVRVTDTLECLLSPFYLSYPFLSKHFINSVLHYFWFRLSRFYRRFYCLFYVSLLVFIFSYLFSCYVKHIDFHLCMKCAIQIKLPYRIIIISFNVFYLLKDPETAVKYSVKIQLIKSSYFDQISDKYSYWSSGLFFDFCVSSTFSIVVCVLCFWFRLLIYLCIYCTYILLRDSVFCSGFFPSFSVGSVGVFLLLVFPV